MGSFSISGGVEVYGFISPSNTTDQYPVIDPLYGIDGLRNVNTLSDLDLIPILRRRAGMLVGVSGGTIYYKLKDVPWNNTISDWELFELGSNFTGGTVTGATIFTNGLTANTISATTYLNINAVTGGSYSNGVITLSGTGNVNGNNIVGLPTYVPFLRNETNPNSTDTIQINNSIFNPSDLTILNTSVFIVDTNADYYILGDLYNFGSLIVDGVLKVGGVIYNNGIISGSGIIE